MTNFEAQMILMWSLIFIAYTVPPIMRKLGNTKTDGLFNSYQVGMMANMMALGAFISYFLTNLFQ
jgi:hypothetical protein